MKETKFIDQNKEKWAKFEKLSKKKTADPDEISKLFVEITDDLSYAKTHYPKRTVRVYLNNLAQSVFLHLHKSRSASGKFGKFWREDLPLEMYRARKVMLFVFLFFMFAVFLGVLSTHNNSNFLGVFTGQYYLEETDAAIERGDPAAIYASEDESSMFLAIATNNVRVSFFAFVLGIVFSVGSLLFMLYNGIMLGSFLYYFHLKSALLTASSAIWIHGAFEISSILLAGTAGLVVGNSILFPGTYTRGQSMIIGGKRGIRIILGMLPFLVFAAFMESYVTRHYLDMHPAMNWSIIFACLLIMVGYFVLYPIFRFHNKETEEMKEDPVVKPKSDFKFWKIRKTSEIFTSAFTLSRLTFVKSGKVLLPLFVIHMAVALTYLFFTNDYVALDYWRSTLGTFTGIKADPDYIMILIHVVFLSLSCGAVMLSTVITEQKQSWQFSTWLVASLKSSILVLTVFAIFLLTSGFLAFLLVCFIPFMMMGIYELIRKNNFFKGVGLGFKDFFNTIGLFALFGLVLMLIHFAMFQLEFQTPTFTLETHSDLIVRQIQSLIELHVLPVMEYPEIAAFMLFAALYVAILHFMIPVIYTAMSLNLYTNREKENAAGLFERLEVFGKKSNVYESDLD